MSGCLIALALFFYFIGFVIWINQRKSRPTFDDTKHNPQHLGQTLDRLIPNDPRQMTSVRHASNSNRDEGSMVQSVSKLNSFHIGDRIRVEHPVQGEYTVFVQGRVTFSELWQKSRTAQSSWVPTGNQFIGLWLEANLFVLEWQNRLYLLDENVRLSDGEIQRDFAPHARKFAQSDQTAEVLFAYPPVMWRMVDIGKFIINSVEGQGIQVQPGAVGRFIHASGEGQRALVLEDYESGGQDIVWIGYAISEIIKS